MAKHAEHLTIAPFDQVEYVVAAEGHRGPILVTRKQRRKSLGLPRPAHAGGWFKSNVHAINEELAKPIEVEHPERFVPAIAEGAGRNSSAAFLDTVRLALADANPLDSEAWVAANPLPKTITFRDGRES